MSANPILLTGLGAALSLFLSGGGAAYATAHASIFAIRHRDNIAMIPVIQAGVLAVYGIIIGYKLSTKMVSDDASLSVTSSDGYRFFSAGLSVGLACLASGFGMGLYLKQLNKEGYYFVRKGSSDPKDDAPKKMSLVTFILCLIYLEAIGLYGLIVALFFVG
jgi:V-type H+-transporting ATPase proteolipid subunit